MKKNTLPTIVLPKGRLYKQLYDFYNQKGVVLPSYDTKKYFFEKYFNDCNLFIAKPKSIPQLINSKIVEFGFCGYDIVDNTDYNDNVVQMFDTNLNKVKLVVALRENMSDLLKQKRPLIIATEYEIVATNYFTKLGIPHYVINTTGSTEGYIDVGADVIIDVVETGNTLLKNGLNIYDVIYETTTQLFSHASLSECELPSIIEILFKK